MWSVRSLPDGPFSICGAHDPLASKKEVRYFIFNTQTTARARNKSSKSDLLFKTRLFLFLVGAWKK